MNSLIKQDSVEIRILLIRGQRIMLDKDLAELYEVETKYLNRQVRRNIQRFPKEFMFRLSEREKNELVTNWHRFQILKHSSSLPYAFTEHGVAMLTTVLNSDIAVKASIRIIKTFIKLRKFISTHKRLGQKLKQLENKVEKHDLEIQNIFNAIHKIMSFPEKPKRKVGFHVD